MNKLLYSLLLISALLIGCVTTEHKGVNLLFKTLEATSKAARPISTEEEHYVGRAAAARILMSYQLYDNRMLTEYINLVGQTVVMHSDRPFTHAGYHFAVLDTNEINAFACPGGIIFITREMIHMTRNEDELASVLAHEIAHISHRDGIASIKQARWTEALTIIGTTAVKEYGSRDLAQLVSIFEGSVDDVFKTLVVNGYGQSQEYSADESAMSYLAKAGYNPKALKHFLERMTTLGKESEGGILKTHPGTGDRIENVKKKLPPVKVPDDFIHLRASRYHKILSSCQ